MTETSLMAADIALCRMDEVPEDGALRVELEGRPPLAVFRVGGRFHVTDDTCTHGEASLAEGEIDVEEGIVECPWHAGAFELATGKPCGAPCTVALRVHAFEERDGRLFLKE
ncbi:non-heme iron oxygenase ferredoxin subunit [Xanthobacter sp. TB0139]|uniref:non-heme iron oxygenase ferredoxin subunit n=1 Tax=Xanthobacter sp. TB0139 TaxID=3459178 RepID=UPI00403A6100